MRTIVVGAGSAGSVIASRLTEDERHDVVLVEAGPDYPAAAENPEVLTPAAPSRWGGTWIRTPPRMGAVVCAESWGSSSRTPA